MGVLPIDVEALLASVREVLARPQAPLPQTGDASLDRALAALAVHQVQAPTLPYWMLKRTELSGQRTRE